MLRVFLAVGLAAALSAQAIAQDANAVIANALKAKIWPLLESGAIKPVIHSVFPAAGASKSHELMESNQHIGKIVLSW